ncbi:MAG: hypothetical protein AB7V36_07110 [Bacteroidales bacterium]
MKTNSIRNIFVLSIILVFVVACRYEDGPLISLNAIENRITGTWHIDEFIKNDIDITTYWVNDYNWKFYFGCPDGCSNGVTMGFGITMTFVPDSLIPDSATSFYNEATYRFEDNFREVVIYFNYRASFSSFGNSEIVCEGCGMPPFLSSKQIYFQIMKLTEKNLWLNTVDENGDHYILKFKPN